MKRIKLIILLFVIGVFSFMIGGNIYFKFNSPLVSHGMTWTTNDETLRVLELRNLGITSIKLKEVLVNEGEIPKKVELIISRNNHFIGGGDLEDDPSITFHGIHFYKIRPEYSLEDLNQFASQQDRSKIKHYGLRIDHDKPIDKITIKYKYFWIPLTLEKVTKID